MRRLIRRFGRPARIVLLVGTVLVAICGSAWLWLRTSLPQIDGEIRVPGIASEVTVARDEHGIPHIRATNALDASFVLGFVHAQDRFAQMELTRRLAAGRMAELLGSEMLAADRSMRTFGIYRLAQQDAAELSGEPRALLDAYVAGVNAWLRRRKGALPLEFYALWFDPEPWVPADSLAWIRLMALRLTDNWTTELLRATLRRHLSESRIDSLFPAPDDDEPTTLAERAAPSSSAIQNAGASFGATLTSGSRATLPAANDFWALAGFEWQAPGGSNAWALAGERTTSGKPIVANDPHLGIGAPGVWYLARLDTPEGTLAGATVPGLPFMVLGHNGRVAWGLTTTHGDAADLIVERLSDGHPEVYLTPFGRQPFTVRNEVIRVRFGEDALHPVRSSRHGPIISDVNELAAAAAGDAHVLALSNIALLPGDPGTEALFSVNRASNVAELQAALRSMRAPQQNIIYADTAGQIALSMPARIPVRADQDGIDIAPGWTAESAWTGFVPFDERPHLTSPESGFIVNANNRLVPDNYPHFISRLWPEGYRAARIEELIVAGASRDLDSAAAVQLDILSGVANDLLTDMLDLAEEAGVDAEIIAALRSWDRRMSADRWEPLVFRAWIDRTIDMIFADEVGPVFELWRADRPAVLRMALRDDPSWCDVKDTEPVEGCGERLAEALRDAFDSLSARYGADWHQWRWGDAHQALFRHPIFGRIPGLRELTDIRIPADGGQHTVNRAGYRPAGDHHLFEMTFGPGYRAIYDLADLDRSRFIVTPGQSGNLMSPHYADLVEDWRAGRYVTLAPIEQPAHLLRLLPKTVER